MTQAGRPDLNKSCIYMEHHLYAISSQVMVAKLVDSGFRSWSGHLPTMTSGYRCYPSMPQFPHL